MTDRHADAIAAVLAGAPDNPSLPVAKVHAIALAWVFQTITDEAGRGTASGRTPRQIADTLVPIVTAVLDDLDTCARARPLSKMGVPRSQELLPGFAADDQQHQAHPY